MNRRIGWLGILLLACFLILFLQLNNLQVLQAHKLANDPGNPRVQLANLDEQRGEILSTDGDVLAESVKVAHPCAGCDQFRRVYPTATATLFSQVVGVQSPYYGLYGVEASYNSDLLQHNRPIQNLGDLLTTSVVTDNVTLTLSAKLQQEVARAFDGKDGAAVVIQPDTGAIEAMFSNPTYDPNSLVAVDPNGSVDVTTEETAFETDNTDDIGGFAPFTSLAYQRNFPTGSTFKTITTAAAYDHTPQLVNAVIPTYGCIPPDTIKGQTTPLCNFGDHYPAPQDSACGGTIAQMLPPSCDTGYALLGTEIGAAFMTDEADSFGFNQQPPIDLPHSSNEVSKFLQPSCYQNAPVFLAFSSIGQDCTQANPLQMAMVAAGIGNGGVIMTPHVMQSISDSQGNLVAVYSPTPWKQATSAATATAVTGLMQKVVTSGTASAVGFPASWDVAAKTGTAQSGVGNSTTTDWMIAFAPANHPKVAVAVMVPDQGTGNDVTGAAVAGPIMKAILGAALGESS